MKVITESLINELHKTHSGINTKKIKWVDIFDTEEELLMAMLNPRVCTDIDNVPSYMWCKGYEYIKSFRRHYNTRGYLTGKQMTQLKRLAPEIAYQIYCR